MPDKITKTISLHPGRTVVEFTLNDVLLRQITNMAGNGNIDMWLVDACRQRLRRLGIEPTG
ncbi:hypothetical protein B4916_23565 [Yersinia intermedia]|nr:hypothetical protein B4916_23565 [Yersinia intermedia]